MPKGYSLHIGVNEVDASKYEKEAKPLASCLNDANAMANIASQKKYTKINILENKTATIEKFVFFMKQYAEELEAGDIFLLSFSGHGMQMETIDPEEEEDDMDEGWCFYDGFVRDKYLFQLWKLFKKGVRIIIVSDSCYSGDVFRFTPPHLFQKIITMNKDKEIEASCLLMAASEEKNITVGNETHGLFTENLLNVWESGQFIESYETLFTEISMFSPNRYIPVIQPFGNIDIPIMAQSPFKI